MSPEQLQAQLAAIVASSDDAIISKDLNGIVLSWNAAAERVFGYVADEMIGQSITMLMPPDRIHEEQEILTQIRRGERVNHFHTVRVHKDGRPIEISVTISPIRDASGTVIGASKIGRDITEFNRSIRERERLFELGKSMSGERDLHSLVQLITDAATDLTGAQFGAFFYNIINESGEAYILYTLSGVDRSHFENFQMPRNTAVFEPTFAGTSVVRSADITQDPRYGKNAPYNGMPSGHLPVRSYLAVPVIGRDQSVLGGLFFGHAKVDVFTERSEQIVASIAGHAGIALENAKLHQELSETAAKFSLMANSIPQLAWMAKPDGSVFWYNERWHKYTGADAASQLGWGWETVIEPGDLPRVKEKWLASVTRGEPWEDIVPLRRLSIVKQLVELHGGTVRAKSAGEGAGATFIVALPLAITKRQTHDRRHPTTSIDHLPGDDIQVSFEGTKILVVDDEPDARNLIERLLTDRKAHVLKAASADAALQIIARERPDVLLSDIGMPEKDGYDLIRALRALPTEEGGRTPAIALTAFARSEDRTRAMMAGYQVHLSKPVEPSELIATVASLVGRTGAG